MKNGSDFMINLCVNGIPIASNDFQPNYPERTKEKAFDTNNNTIWGSMLYPENEGWIGYDFLKPVKIRQIFLTQLSTGGSITKVLLQGFNNDVWEDIQFFHLIIGTNILDIEEPKKFNKYRLLAKTNAITNGWAWTVNEIKMLGYPYSYLFQQNNNYIAIKPEFYKELGQPSTDTERNEWFQKYGTDDLSVLTKIQDKNIEFGINKGNIENGKYFEVSFNNNFLGVSEVK